VPSSPQQNPAPVTYNIPGTYYINLTINDGLPTQNAFCRKVVVIPPPVKSPNQQVSLCSGSSVKIGSSIPSAGYLWSNGSTSDSITITSPGTYWVESSRFGCSVRDSFIVSGMPNTLDFSYSVNSCNPKVIQFNTNLTGNPNISWNFGDGQIISNNPDPIHTYNAFGTYSVTLTAPNNSGCNESVVKVVSVNAAYANALIFNSDTSICPGDSVLLQTSPNTFNNCWTVSQGPLPSGNYVYPLSTTTYTLFNQLKGGNIVVNGNFENGNTGFTSQYIYNPGSGFNSGVYNTGSSIIAWHPGMANCQDHTSGTGKMLMVNGADQLNVNVWTQTIPIQHNTNYVFSTWIQNITFLNPAQLQFSINGSPIGTIFTANSQSCIWEQFYTTWNSGTATSAQIAILNMNSAFSGNDFALDDIFFGSVTQQIDSFTVYMGGACDSLNISGPETICSLNDTVSYSVFRDNCNQPFTVNVDNTYAEVVSQTSDQVKFIFKKAGNTTIKLEINNSCVQYTDSINISIKLSPASIDLGPDLVTCRDTSLILHAGYGFATYQWQNGTTDSTFLVTSPGTYSILAQNYCGASISDNFSFNKVQPAPFLVSPLNANVCMGDSVAFTASGGDEFLWSPVQNFNAPNTGLTKALIDFTGQISVQITDNLCIRDTTIMIPVAVTDKADIQVTKTNDVNCSIDTTILTATGGDNYTWSTSPYITRSNNGIITVKPPVTTTFYVSGTNASGCSGEDSITVEFSKTGDQTLYMPNAFTPNRDGLNDIYKAAFIGPYRQFDFSIFNRWGELVFRSKSPDKGWDGTYKGKLQSGDVFVYYITAEGGCDGKFVQKGTFVLIR
jgi:gliding motility-associated-like protein